MVDRRRRHSPLLRPLAVEIGRADRLGLGGLPLGSFRRGGDFLGRNGFTLRPSAWRQTAFGLVLVKADLTCLPFFFPAFAFLP
jgi:hypothetical protein